jgi:hypothetical protein
MRFEWLEILQLTQDHGDSKISIVFISHFVMMCLFRQNAMSAFHGNKKIFKRKEPKPLQDPMEKYRLRLFIGRKTGRLDLATKVIWPLKNGSDYQEPAHASDSLVENDSSLGEGSSQELKTGDKENNNNADNDLSVEGHDQLNAPLDRDSLSELRPGSSNAEIRNLFADLVNTGGGGGVSKQVSFRGPLNQESDSIKQLSSKQLSTRSGFDNGNDNNGFVDDDKSVHSVHSDFHEKEGAVVIPTSLPPSQEIEFRLNVFPPEIVKISGKEFYSVLKVNNL